MSLFIEGHPGVFLLLTIVLGGGAAFMAGRSLAKGWKPLWVALAYMIPMGAAVRFMHFALYEAKLTSLQYFITHTAILMLAAYVGYRMTRTDQMADQYPWLYEKSGPFTWKSKDMAE
jgi:hypothetical protein